MGILASRWGRASWGTLTWGSGYSSTAKVEYTEQLAKDDTVFCCKLSDPATDVSQFERAWTASGTGAYRSSASEWQIDGSGDGRTVEAEFTWATGDGTAVIARVGDPSTTLPSSSFSLWVDAGVLQAYVGTTKVCEIALPESSASRCRFVAWWGTRPNPLTTGASDALVSELLVRNATEGRWSEMDMGTHAVSTTDPTWTASVGGRWNGASFLNPLAEAIIACRLSATYHSSVEFGEDFVAARGANTTKDLRRAQPYLGPAGLFAADEAYGPQAAQANEAAVQADLRMASPLWNEIFDEVTQLNRGTSPDMLAPPGSDFTMSAFFLRWVMVPPIVRHARVRVQVNAWQTDATPRSCDVRVYSVDRLPLSPKYTIGQGGGGVTPPSWSWCEAATTSQVGSSGATGEWLDLGLLDLQVNGSPARRDNGTTFLAVAYRVPAAASRIAIKAVNVTPAVPNASAAGFQQFGAIGG